MKNSGLTKHKLAKALKKLRGMNLVHYFPFRVGSRFRGGDFVVDTHPMTESVARDLFLKVYPHYSPRKPGSAPVVAVPPGPVKPKTPIPSNDGPSVDLAPEEFVENFEDSNEPALNRSS